jgi:hypothetical protein
MSRTLDRLIQNRSRDSRRSLYSRDFRTSYYSEAKEIVKLTMELKEILGQLPKGWDEVDTSTDDRKVPEGWDEVDTAPGESEGYRYRLLPKIFSNVREIYSSPKIRRQLIQYYIKNRRKERMRSRGYSKRMHHLTRNNQISADYLIHNMYMELGRIMYFSIWSKTWGKIKEFWPKLACICRAFVKKIGPAVTLMATTLLSGASAWTLIEKLNQKWLVSLAIWTSESASLAKTDNNTKTAVAVLAVSGGLIAAGILWAIALSAKDCDGKLGPVASVLYARAQDVLIDALKALLPMKPEEIEEKELPQLLSSVADYLLSDEPEKLFSVFENILNKIKQSTKKVNDYFPGMGKVENISNIMNRMKNVDKLIIECKISSGLKQLINSYGGEGIEVPDTITLLGGSKGNKKLPGMLPIIAFLTSPRVEFKIDDGQTTMSFWPFRYFRDYGGLNQQKVNNFVITYLQNKDLLEEIEKEIEKIIKTTEE